MNRPGHTRRRLIQISALGLSTGIAGCSDNDPGSSARDDYDDSPGEDAAPDGDTNDAPAPALTFNAPNRNYPLYRLPLAEGRPDPSDMSVDHPDNTLFTIEVHGEQTATATLEQTQVHRDIELRLYVRDTYGKFKSTTQPLESSGDNTFETYEIEFDISNINLPRGAGSICELVAVDPTFNEDYEFIIKRHQFVGVGHKNGVNWVNSEYLNHTYHTEPDGFRKHDNPRGIGGIGGGSEISEPAGYVETRDGDNERTVFLVTRTNYNGEIFGVSSHIKHEPINRYQNGSNRYQYRYGQQYEAHHATEISHFQELATKTHTAITDIGVKGSNNRLEVLGDMIQMIPYLRQGTDPMPSVILYEHYGDCSSKSVLMACILQNDPWNVMSAYIDCEINGVGHWTIGIDVDDLGSGFDRDSSFLVAPSDDLKSSGFPNTSYAFFDMTYDSYIGERTGGVENSFIYDEGDFTHRNNRYANDPPNY
ncbi:hypothetical protein [Halorubrum sp. HHNYT27]|uniref:hypothetical protein n=1 Tax=Halorubrum sp. HHNYT27 TaxID=3402275 RepID=UPI003EC080FB